MNIELMVLSRVNEVLLKLSFLDEIHEGQRLKEDLGLDSLSLSELMAALEDIFAVEFQMDDLDPSNFITVADVYTLIEKYMEEEAPVCAL